MYPILSNKDRPVILEKYFAESAVRSLDRFMVACDHEENIRRKYLRFYSESQIEPLQCVKSPLNAWSDGRVSRKEITVKLYTHSISRKQNTSLEAVKDLSAVTAERIFESMDIYPATRTNNLGVARNLKTERVISVKAFPNRFSIDDWVNLVLTHSLVKVRQLLLLFGEKPILWTSSSRLALTPG